MNIEEEDIARTPKKHKIESEGQLVKSIEENKKMKVIGPAFEVKEYAFTDTLVYSTT